MRLSLGFISRHLPFPVLDFSSDISEERYEEVRWLLQDQHGFEKEVIYVTDHIPTDEALASGCAFVVVGEIPDDVGFSTAEILAVDSSHSCDEVLGAIAHLLERYKEYELELSRLIYKPDGLVDVCKLFFKILGCPTCFTNANFKVLAYYGDKDSSEASYLWNHIVSDGFWPYSELQRLITVDMARRFESPDRPVLMRISEASYPFIRLSILLDGRYQGYFFVHSILKILDADDVEIVDELRPYITEAFLNDPSVSPPKNFKYEHFILDVINGTISDRDLIRQRSANIGLDADGEFAVILFETHNRNKPLSEILLRELYLLQQCVPFLDDGDVRVIVQAEDPEMHSKLIEKMGFLSKKYDCRISASERFRGIWNSPTYSTQADLALQYESEFGFSGICRMFEEVYFAALYGSIANRSAIDPEVFINRSARLLAAYEDTKSLDYIDTLKAYVYCRGNSLKTSEMLHIHRSSLTYRLRKIAEFGELDTEDFSAMMRTSMSLQILKALPGK